MAIRDRLTVHCDDGTNVGLIVAKAGGEITVEAPTKATPWLRAQEIGQNGEVRESILVPAEHIVWYSRDRVPLAPKKGRKQSE